MKDNPSTTDHTHEGGRPSRSDVDATRVSHGGGTARDDAPADDGESGEMVDRMLGEFHLLRRLGRGGMADVYLAEQTSLKRRVALKVLRDDQLAKTGTKLLERFQREAKAAGGLSHPNIVHVHSVGEADGVHYIVQEYVQGPTLKSFLARKGPPDLPLALHIMKQVASALEAAADAGIVHRDIKPENIMLTRKGEVKVADFGLALLTQREEGVDLTQHGVTLGTPSYMSPEQVQGAKVDRRSDIYSFGVTCYHMFSGKPPFRGQTAMSVAVQHVKDEPEPLSVLRPDLPGILCEIVHKMMQKDPDERYQDTQTLLADIRQVGKILKEQPDAAGTLRLADVGTREPRRKRSPAAPRWAVQRPAVAFGLLFVIVGSASAGAGWLMRPRNPFDAPPPKITEVPIEDTAQDQFRLAMRLVSDKDAWAVGMVTDEDAWKAVIDHFTPDDPEYYRAVEKLALVYLNQQKFDEALKQFNELAFLGSEHADLKVTGVAGQAVVACLQGDHAESQRIIEVNLRQAVQLLPRPRQIDPIMERLVSEAIEHNKKQLGDEAVKDFQSLFQSTSADESAPLINE